MAHSETRKLEDVPSVKSDPANGEFFLGLSVVENG